MEKTSLRSRLALAATLVLLIGWVTIPTVLPATGAIDAMHVLDTGVGVGTSNPQATLHAVESDASLHDRVLGRLTGATFAPQFEYQDGATGDIWREGMNNAGHFVINQMDDPPVAELRISPDGQVFVNGSQVHPDYVFDDDYDLMDLEALASYIRTNRHLPGVVSSEQAQGQIDLSSLPLQLLEKIEELTLHTIEQQREISAQQREIDELRAQLTAIQESLDLD